MSLARIAMVSLVMVFANTVMASASEILEQCQVAITEPKDIKKNPILAGIDIGYCFGYLRGISDYSTGTAYMTPQQVKVFKSCRPDNVDNKQLAKIIVKYIENNPKYAHFDQVTIVSLALSDAFPCK